ncbi:hypothetical protein CBL_00893 [Carabus blaptoides fortunei]
MERGGAEAGVFCEAPQVSAVAPRTEVMMGLACRWRRARPSGSLHRNGSRNRHPWGFGPSVPAAQHHFGSKSFVEGGTCICTCANWLTQLEQASSHSVKEAMHQWPRDSLAIVLQPPPSLEGFACQDKGD